MRTRLPIFHDFSSTPSRSPSMTTPCLQNLTPFGPSARAAPPTSATKTLAMSSFTPAPPPPPTLAGLNPQAAENIEEQLRSSAGASEYAGSRAPPPGLNPATTAEYVA